MEHPLQSSSLYPSYCSTALPICAPAPRPPFNLWTCTPAPISSPYSLIPALHRQGHSPNLVPLHRFTSRPPQCDLHQALRHRAVHRQQNLRAAVRRLQGAPAQAGEVQLGLQASVGTCVGRPRRRRWRCAPLLPAHCRAARQGAVRHDNPLPVRWLARL